MERIDRIEKAIEELVASQKATDVQLAKTDAQLAKTDVQLAELIESQKEMSKRAEVQMAELRESQKEMSKRAEVQMAELRESQKEMSKRAEVQMAELRESQKEMSKRAEVQMVELRESQKEMNKQLGGIGNTHGEFAENFFFSSLSQKKELGGIKFDYIERNVKRRVRNLTDEFDIVLYNGDSVGLLEIKNTVKAANVTQLLTTKLQNFKTLNPEYADAKIYLGIGGFTFENEDVKKNAIAAGVIVLEVKGDHFEADIENMRPF